MGLELTQEKADKNKNSFFTHTDTCLTVDGVTKVLLGHADEGAADEKEDGEAIVEAEHPVVDADLLRPQQVPNAREELQGHGSVFSAASSSHCPRSCRNIRKDRLKLFHFHC